MRTTYKLLPGDTVEVTPDNNYIGAQGIITGMEIIAPAAMRVYVQTGDMQTIRARHDRIKFMRRGGHAASTLANKASELRRAIAKAKSKKELDTLTAQLKTTNQLISCLIRNTGGNHA